VGQRERRQGGVAGVSAVPRSAATRRNAGGQDGVGKLVDQGGQEPTLQLLVASTEAESLGAVLLLQKSAGAARIYDANVRVT